MRQLGASSQHAAAVASQHALRRRSGEGILPIRTFVMVVTPRGQNCACSAIRPILNCPFRVAHWQTIRLEPKHWWKISRRTYTLVTLVACLTCFRLTTDQPSPGFQILTATRVSFAHTSNSLVPTIRTMPLHKGEPPHCTIHGTEIWLRYPRAPIKVEISL